MMGLGKGGLRLKIGPSLVSMLDFWGVSGQDHPYLQTMKRPFGRGPTTLVTLGMKLIAKAIQLFAKWDDPPSTVS